MNTVTAHLKPGREKPVVLGHPWVFSGAVASWSSSPQSGQCVDLVSARGEWLARGLAETGGNLAVRLYTRHETEAIDDALFARKLENAMAMRVSIIAPQEPDTDAFRLCFSESDGLSGLIVDQYAGHASVHLNTSVLAPFLPALAATLQKRGLKPVLTEEAVSAEPLHPPEIKESGFLYQVDLSGGQKTGFYLDQRVNRRRVAAYVAGRRCLSAYCYTGGFETHLSHGGAAHITGIDRSEPAIAAARTNLLLNPGGTPVDHFVADVPDFLRKCRDNRTTFDLIVLDPPKFVHNQGQLAKGLRAYKDTNLLAMKLLTPGGILATFSCSGWVKREQFLTALDWAAQDAGRTVQILEHLSQPADHPILLPFPESDYLCGYVLRVE